MVKLDRTTDTTGKHSVSLLNYGSSVTSITSVQCQCISSASVLQMLYVPKSLCPRRAMFQELYVPEALCFGSPMLRFCAPQTLCSKSSVFQGTSSQRRDGFFNNFSVMQFGCYANMLAVMHTYLSRLCLCLCLYLSVSVCLSLSVCLCLSVCLSPSLPHSVTQSIILIIHPLI